MIAWLESGKIGTTAKAAQEAGKWVRDDGEKGAGWLHILHNHVNTNNGNDFEGAFGRAYREVANIQRLILQAANKAALIPRQQFDGFANIEGSNLWMEIGSNGFIVTAYPVSQ